MKKVLFIVPHEDDELLIGGALLINLVRDNGYDVSVFIATNGDYNPLQHSTRIQESLCALRSIGVRMDHIFFGGYGDSWKGKHIYNSGNDEIKESHGGFKATYLDVLGVEEWHYQRFNEHVPYTRKGYLNDIKDLINTMLPDVIICVDMDSHRDHRCLSLLVEEALSGILKKDGTAYSPILMKKYAYQGVLHGKYDFFSYPLKRTCNDSNDTCNPYYKWDERVSYSVPVDCSTQFIFCNYLNKLARMYCSQDVWMWVPCFVNEDIVFWLRNTNNLALTSKITVSSGKEEYLNDFKLIDTNDVEKENCDYAELCWRPDVHDSDRCIIIKLHAQRKIKHVKVYFNTPGGLNGCYVFHYIDSSGNHHTSERNVGDDKDFFVDTIDVNLAEIMILEFEFKNVKGNLGIGEIEVLPDLVQIPFQEYLYHEKQYNSGVFRFMNCLLFVEKIIFKMYVAVYSMFKRFRRSLIKRKRYLSTIVGRL